MSKNPHKSSSGFTIVETLVAIAIIMIALVGPFEAVENALSASEISRDELIGNSLAQEGVEYVRSIRDDNFLYTSAHTGNTTHWLGGLDGTSNGSGTIRADCFANSCAIDPLYSTVTACSGTCSAYPLYIAPVGAAIPYLYTLQGNGLDSYVQSRFTRYISLCYMNGASCNSVVSNEARLTVTVYWSTQKQPYTTTITEYLQNWL